MEGKIKWFENRKGYGFIIGSDGEDYFVHHSNIVGNGYKSLDTNDKVEFSVMLGGKGKYAGEVKKVA